MMMVTTTLDLGAAMLVDAVAGGTGMPTVTGVATTVGAMGMVGLRVLNGWTWSLQGQHTTQRGGHADRHGGDSRRWAPKRGARETQES
jgi:hypothetical protein